MKKSITTLLLAFLTVQLPQFGVRAQNVWHDAGKISSGAVLCFNVYSDSLIIAGCDRDGLFISSDRGRTWGKIDSFPSIGVSVLYRENDSELLAGTPKGIYRSDNRGKSWSGPLPGSGGHTVLSIVQSPGGDVVAGYREGGILISRKGGTEWRKALEGHTITSLVRATDGTLYCISDNQKILTAKENPELWNEYPLQLPGKIRLLTFTIDRNSLLVGTDKGIFEHSENNEQWGVLMDRKPAEIIVRTVDGNLYYASQWYGLLSREKDSAGYYGSGRSYNGSVTAMVLFDGSILFVGTNDGRVAFTSLANSVRPADDSTVVFSFGIPFSLGQTTRWLTGLSLEVRPHRVISLQLGLLFGFFLSRRNEFTEALARLKLHPLRSIDVYGGVGYCGAGLIGGAHGMTEDRTPATYEFFLGYQPHRLLSLEAGYRYSNQPYRLYYGWEGFEKTYLREFFFEITFDFLNF